MRINLSKFKNELLDFCCSDTLREIDYGVLDLSRIDDVELRQALYFQEELLTVELEINYLENSTGIFRVSIEREFWCYKQGKEVICASSLVELRQIVESENRIWYVFDELSAQRVESKIFDG